MASGARNQKAVYWAFSDWDAAGNPTVVDPVELDVRWERGLSQEVTPNVNPKEVEATVWIGREIALSGVMWKGKLVDLPSPVTGVREVVEYQEIPDVKGRTFERIVLLGKYKDSLPTVA